MISQSASLDPDIHSGVWAISGTYGAFTPLMYLPARIWSQQNQDSPFRVGVLNILAGHSGPETAADARTHFGIIAQDLQDAFTAEGLDAGKYAMFISDTWWAKDGEVWMNESDAPSDATKITKLGVRYTELLAFIISAI